MRARRLEQRKRAAKIGLEDRRRRQDAAIDVRFRGEIDDRVRPRFLKQAIHQLGVANVAVHKLVARNPR